MKDQLFNRKILFSLLAVVMCLGFTAMSYGVVVVSVDPATIESPAAGEQLMVSINIAGGAGVAGYQVTLNFDPTALSYVAAANADYLQGDPAAGTLFPVIRPADASVIVGATVIGVPSSDGDGTLATVTFEVLEAKASTISLTDVVVSDAAAQTLEVTSADGMVTAPVAEEVTEETTEETTEEVTEETTEETTEEVTEETTEEEVVEETIEVEVVEETTEVEVVEETTEVEVVEETTEVEVVEETTEVEVVEETTEVEVVEETTEVEVVEETTEVEVVEETTEVSRSS